MQRGLGIVTLSSIAIFALTGCISLTQYYARVPSTTPIGVDPIGGFALFFWVDPDGIVCHGAPGSSGQPGPAVIEAAKPAAVQDSKTNTVVVSTQLLVYQLIPYSLTEYLSSGATGYHLFQFDNVLWRDRSNGEAFRDLAKHYYSVPQAIDVGSLPMTLRPELAWGQTDCDIGEFIALPDAGRESSGQHPTQCRTKAFPSSGVDAEERLLANCAKRLREGTRYRFY
jgi:hypothetical protein